MAKMLMGQINHARERITTITAEKLGIKPDAPNLPGESEFRTGVDDGTIKITPTFLAKALAAWQAEAPRTEVKESGGSWDYRTRTTSATTVSVITKNGGSLASYLAYTWYQKKHEAAVAVFVADNEEYQRRRGIIRAEASRVEDAIVLGDNAAALAALEAFVAFSV